MPGGFNPEPGQGRAREQWALKRGGGEKYIALEDEKITWDEQALKGAGSANGVRLGKAPSSGFQAWHHRGAGFLRGYEPKRESRGQGGKTPNYKTGFGGCPIALIWPSERSLHFGG